MRDNLIICFCLLLACNSLASSIKWVDITHKKAYRIDTQNKTLEVETTPEQWQLLGKVTLIGVEDLDINASNRFVCLQGKQSHQSFILTDCTNQVYVFDFDKMLLERIDKTYYRGYNCLSSRFVRKDVIYCVGGYGMFRTNNLMTYFHKESKEWEAISPANDAPKSIHMGLDGYYKEKDVFFSGLNYSYSDSENGSKPVIDFGFYEYNFGNKLWQKLGIINDDEFKLFSSESLNKNIHWNGKYFLIHYFRPPYGRVLIIDPVKNEVYLWDDKEKLFYPGIPSYETDFAKEYVIGDSLYSIQTLTTQKGTFTKNVFSIEQMKQNATLLGELYVSEYYTALPYSLVVFALLGAVAFGFIYKRKKVNVKKSSSIDLNEIEKAIFEALVACSKDGGLSAEQINDIMGIGTKSFENQRRLRSDFIRNMEIKLGQIYQIDNPIERIPSKLDRRMIGYVLNDKILERVKGV